MMTTITNSGIGLLRDAAAQGFDNIVDFLVFGACCVVVLTGLMIKVKLNSAKYRR